MSGNLPQNVDLEQVEELNLRQPVQNRGLRASCNSIPRNLLQKSCPPNALRPLPTNLPTPVLAPCLGTWLDRPF